MRADGVIDAMLEFFATGVSPIPAEQTITIAALLEESCKLLHKK